jgi:hypothetical protein
MKFIKRGRFWLKMAIGASTVPIVAAIACLRFVDYSPYLKSAYFEETIARLPASDANSALVTAELEAGFGSARLTPELGAGADNAARGEFSAVPLAGYGGRQGRPASGVHDDVHAKAVAFKAGNRLGVLVGADALIIPREVADRAAAQLLRESNLTREQIYFGATHTHSSLGGWGEGFVGESFAGPYNRAQSEWFSARLVAAVQRALTNLQPASLGHGAVRVPDLVRNRLAGKLGTVDPEFSFLAVRQSGTGRLGVVGTYAAHATVLSANNMQFSGDYPGYWQRAIEQSTGGFALFLGGAMGSHSPVPPTGGFEGAERMGARLAALVREELPLVALTNVVTFGYRGLEVSLPSVHARLIDQVRLRPWLARRLLPISDRTFIQGFRLQQTVWLSTPCDFSGELALDLKDFAGARGFRAVLTSFNGDYIGYVIPARYFHLSGYEPRLMSFYGPTTAEYLEDLLRRVALSLQ